MLENVHALLKRSPKTGLELLDGIDVVMKLCAVGLCGRELNPAGFL
jgi:hypothetical protein